MMYRKVTFAKSYCTVKMMLAWAVEIDVSLSIDSSFYFCFDLAFIHLSVHLKQLSTICYQQFSPSISDSNTGHAVEASVGSIIVLVKVTTVIVCFI